MIDDLCVTAEVTFVVSKAADVPGLTSSLDHTPAESR